MRSILALFLLAVAGPVFAQWTTTAPPSYLQAGARAVTVAPQSQLTPGALLTSLLQGRTYTPGASAGSLDIRDVTKGINPAGGVPIDVTMKRALQWSAIARGAAKALPLISTAIAVKELFDEVRCRESFGGAGECDLGVNEVPVNCLKVFKNGGLNPSGLACKASAAEAAAYWAQVHSTPACSGWGCSYGTWTALSWPSGTVGPVKFSLTSCGTYQGGPVQCSTSESWGDLGLYGSTVQCPTINTGSGLITPVPGTDGKCPTLTYSPAPAEVIEQRVTDYGGQHRAPLIVPPMDQAGIPIEHAPPVLEPPASVPGGRQTTSHPDGSTTTRDVDHPITPTADGYKWEDRITERTWPPGVTPDAPGTPPGSGTPPGTTTTGGTTPQPVSVITCGLPGTPPCKIDESGTPTGAGALDPANAQIAGATAAIVGAMTPATLPWLFVFDLPQGACSALEIPEVFAGAGSRSFDLCSQPAALLWREFYAWIISVAAMWYAWKRYSEEVGAR